MHVFGKQYRNTLSFSLCILLLNLLFINKSMAHGVESRILENMATTAIADVHYSDGSPMSYSEVTIWSPENDSVEFQNGRTDKNGRFSFCPDVNGVWRIIVSDELGHAATLEHEFNDSIDGTIKYGAVVNSTTSASTMTYVFLGCSLIVNAGFVIGRFKKVLRKRTHSAS